MEFFFCLFIYLFTYLFCLCLYSFIFSFQLFIYFLTFFYFHFLSHFLFSLYSFQVIVNLDFVLQIIIEALIQKNVDEEKRLRLVYIKGDTDGDGVLSFQEFQGVYVLNSTYDPCTILSFFVFFISYCLPFIHSFFFSFFLPHPLLHHSHAPLPSSHLPLLPLR